MARGTPHPRNETGKYFIINFSFFSKRMLGALLVALFSGSALAQTALLSDKPVPDKPVATPSLPLPQLEGKTIDGSPFDLNMLKGKVVLVMFWSTGCAVCRNEMPELRSNYAGWAGKPFELVAVSTDAKVQDLLDCERIISRTVPSKERFVQLWTGESGYKDNLGKHGRLPAAYLLDKTGKLVERYAGLIPLEAWDNIANLL